MALEIFNKMENMKELVESINKLYPDEYQNFLNYVNIDADDNDSLLIKFQNGPRKEVGTNGVQIDLLFLIGQQILKGLNKEFPCDENERAIGWLNLVISTLQERTKKRIEEGIEGLNK